MYPSFSIIVPSFNQADYIEATLLNLKSLKEKAKEKGIKIEVLLFDSCSNKETLAIIERHQSVIDYLEIEKDKGQFDAINKGMAKCNHDYWTWLNTDDLLEEKGFFELAEVLKKHNDIDYIYGGVKYIDAKGNFIKQFDAYELSYQKLISTDPAIFQPGSFFKKSFTDKVGLLASYSCCFDYEYILRLLKNKAKFYCCHFPVSCFRYYSDSKTGSKTVQFIKEQLIISKQYGRKWYHYLSAFSKLRLVKHFLFPRK